MNSPAEERLQRMLEEGKITPEQYQQLRAALNAATSDPTPEETSDRLAGEDVDRILRDLLETDRKLSDSSVLALRKRILLWGMIMCVIGLAVGLMMDLPLVWGMSLPGLIVGRYKWARLMKMNDAP
jgi:hypothetical protein